jgi:hypothetical protein
VIGLREKVAELEYQIEQDNQPIKYFHRPGVIVAVRGAGAIGLVEELDNRIAALEAVLVAANEYVRDSYRPVPKYDAMRFDALSHAVNEALNGGRDDE